MKHWILLFLVLGLSVASVTAQETDLFNAGRDRVVFVDLERVFNEFYKTELAKSRVELQQKDIDAEKQLMVDEMTQISAAVDALKAEARDTTLAEEVRDSKRMFYEERLLELRKKQKEIEDFVERRQKQLQLQVSRMSQTVMDEIKQTVIEYAKAQGLMAVMDRSARRASVGVFIYTHPDVDITDRILNVLNRKRPNKQLHATLDQNEADKTGQQEGPSGK